MKKILLICLATMIVGCQKQPEKVDDSAADKQFEESDKKIGEFLDTLENPHASKGEQKKILCNDYPKVYEYQYIPALLKLSKAESKDQLMKDLKMTTNYYSEKLGIICD